LKKTRASSNAKGTDVWMISAAVPTWMCWIATNINPKWSVPMVTDSQKIRHM
jgi:hypothetical protein